MSAFPTSSWRRPHLQSANGCYPYDIHASIESMGISCHSSHYYSSSHSLLGKTAGELTAPPAAFPALWDLCRREDASWAVLAWSLHVLWPVCKDGNSCVAFTSTIKLNLNERPCRLSVLREERKGWPEEIMKCEKLLFANTTFHISKMFIAVKMFLTFSSQPIKF